MQSKRKGGMLVLVEFQSQGWRGLFACGRFGGPLSYHLPSALPVSSWGPWPALPLAPLVSSCPTRCSLKKKGKKVEGAATVPQSKQIVLLQSLDWCCLHG